MKLSRRSLPYLVLVLTAAVMSAALLLVATHRWGLGVSYDSVVYVQASHSLSAIPLPQPRDLGGQPLYWWAPAYPLLLKGFGGTYANARILNALLLLGGALLIGATAWKLLEARSGVVAAFLYAFSPAVFAAHLQLLAEPLFLLFAIASLAFIAVRRPIPGGVAAGLATLTRYAGLPLIVTGAVVLRGRQRIEFLAPSLALYLGWLARNEIVAGQATGREFRWHPPSSAALSAGLGAFAHLLITPGHLPSIRLPLGNAGAVAEALACIALIVGALRADWKRPPRIVLIGLTYCALYCVFLILTATFFDALTPLDERLLIPIIPALVVTMAWVLRGQPVVAAVLASVFVAAVLQQAHTFSRYGQDYSGRIWSAARIDRSSLPPGQLVSTWPAAIAYFTGRSPQRFPNPIDEHTDAVNPRFDSQVRQLAREIRQGQVTLITLNEAFLEIPTNPIPIAAQLGLKNECRSLKPVVYICTARPTVP